MAQEYLLAVAGLCLLGAAALAGHRHVRRARYEPRHTAEQPVVHVGATEESPRLVDLPLAPPPPPIDPGVLLVEVEAELVRITRRRDELLALVQRQDEQRLHIALDAMERGFRQQLSRTGRAVHLEADTAEWRRSDIRRIVRSGAPR